MSRISQRMIRVIKNPLRIVLFLDSHGRIHLKDEIYLKILYKTMIGKKLNIKDPKTFNEKLQWLKLHNRKDIYTTMVDKDKVKKYIAETIGKEYIIPTLGVYSNFDEIDFNKLPKQFIIKCTHDSGGLVIVKNKDDLDIDATREKIEKSLSRNYYYSGREWPYKNVEPKIIIEKYLQDKKNDDIRDYKFFVFNGKVKCFKVDFDRFTKHGANYYDRNAKLLRFGEVVCPPDFDKIIEMPTNLKKMIRLAEKLSNNIPFVRVDFYEVCGKVYFGEITFYPACGTGKFIPEKWDETLGNWINLEKGL